MQNVISELVTILLDDGNSWHSQLQAAKILGKIGQVAATTSIPCLIVESEKHNDAATMALREMGLEKRNN